MLLHEILEFGKVASGILEFKGKSDLVLIDYLTKWLENVQK